MILYDGPLMVYHILPISTAVLDSGHPFGNSTTSTINQVINDMHVFVGCEHIEAIYHPLRANISIVIQPKFTNTSLFCGQQYYPIGAARTVNSRGGRVF